MYNRKIVFLILISLVFFIIAGSYCFVYKGWYLKDFFNNKDINTESVVIGFAPDLNYLPLIAIDRGFLKEGGLDVKVVEYPTGQVVLDSLISGDIDVGIIGLGPFVFESFKRDDLKIFGSVSTFFDLYKVVANVDSNIKITDDIKGKKIAVAYGSTFHTFLHYFLLENSLSEDDVEIHFAKNNKEVLDLFEKGEVDAIVSRDPFISEIKKTRGEGVVVLSEPGLFLNIFNLVTINDFIKENPGIIKKILRSMLKAEDFVKDNPRESVDLLVKRLRVDRDVFLSDWKKSDLKVSLDRGLIISLESFARWAVKNNLTDKKVIPNYLNNIDSTYLNSLRPENVGVMSQNKK